MRISFRYTFAYNISLGPNNGSFREDLSKVKFLDIFITHPLKIQQLVFPLHKTSYHFNFALTQKADT